MKSFEEVEKVVKQTLSPERFEHSKGVMERCIEFATMYGEDVEKAKLMGIAHDIAKEIPREKRVELAEADGVKLDEFEKQNKALIHSKHGAVICKRDFGFSDDMCEAIANHTAGKSNMSKLDKILYLADYCEKTRDFPEAIKAYELGKQDLDKGCLFALTEKIKYMLEIGSPIHKDSIDAYNDMVKK